ncbi:tryptophan-rich sensory protein [Maricaulis sp.]|uniref:tryptophan-rich sensory protein n=1 Tax=Maricaulis sp. TaxID=1486257 RepID=UPI003A924070
MIRLFLYMLIAASVSGGIVGWIRSSETALWAASLNFPDWAPGGHLPDIVSILMLQLIAISLWITQRADRCTMRLLSVLLTLGLIGGVCLQLCIIFVGRDITTGFLAGLALWLYMLVTMTVVDRCSKASAVLLWLPFAWLTLGLAFAFEVMRLNEGSNFVGGL